LLASLMIVILLVEEGHYRYDAFGFHFIVCLHKFYNV